MPLQPYIMVDVLETLKRVLYSCLVVLIKKAKFNTVKLILQFNVYFNNLNEVLNWLNLIYNPIEKYKYNFLKIIVYKSFGYNT